MAADLMADTSILTCLYMTAGVPGYVVLLWQVMLEFWQASESRTARIQGQGLPALLEPSHLAAAGKGHMLQASSMQGWAGGCVVIQLSRSSLGVCSVSSSGNQCVSNVTQANRALFQAAPVYHFSKSPLLSLLRP
ncbi:hypothetical protein WJX74_008080 [Apatococcus lobatus]|uniref:Uncharacterized protein n=1 Tax=Apatococcus lobatus TaxID=904363 RepID=A0AAW1RQ69_9CHLO